MNRPFAERLKLSTSSYHGTINSLPLFGRILASTATRYDLECLLAVYYFIYQPLERALDDNANNQLIRSFEPHNLLRLPRIENDLTVLLGDNFLEHELVRKIGECRAVNAWRENIERVATQKPEKLVAHMYLRYLGDLFGGSIMGRRIEAGLNFQPSCFYFDGDVPSLRKNFKDSLSAIMENGMQDELIDEAVESYQIQIDIFSSLNSLS